MKKSTLISFEGICDDVINEDGNITLVNLNITHVVVWDVTEWIFEKKKKTIKKLLGIFKTKNGVIPEQAFNIGGYTRYKCPLCNSWMELLNRDDVIHDDLYICDGCLNVEPKGRLEALYV